jgi:peroxiredoxin (alkyl hydroperoxide reductase subunit C)
MRNRLALYDSRPQFVAANSLGTHFSEAMPGGCPAKTVSCTGSANQRINGDTHARVNPALAQTHDPNKMSTLVGKSAPAFKAEAVAGSSFTEIELSQFKGDKYVVLFFYPLDFTFVCPTELHAFQERLADFESRNVQVLGCSIDSKFSHFAWLTTPRNKGGIEGVKYPILSDIQRTIARDYDVLSADGVAYRGLFLIDKDGIVRHQLVNDLPLGRSVEEVLRMVDALKHFEHHGEVCPANWSTGKTAMKATQEGVSGYLAVH